MVLPVTISSFPRTLAIEAKFIDIPGLKVMVLERLSE
jgi:hypothetical protein